MTNYFDDIGRISPIARSIVLEIERLSAGVTMHRMQVTRETHDYGHQVAYQLAGWLARLPEQAVLVVRTPRTWRDWLKRGLTMRWPRLSRWLVVEYRSMRYVASDYLPSVELPADQSVGRFQAWMCGGVGRPVDATTEGEVSE